MEKSRRRFLVQSAAGVAGGFLGTTVVADLSAQQSSSATPQAPPPGQPPAFGTAPPVGPEVSSATFAEAEKLVRVDFTAPQLAQVAASWRVSMAPMYEHRAGPRKVALEDDVAPWSTVRAVQPGMPLGPAHRRFIRSEANAGPLPSRDEDIAWATVTQLSRWMEQRKLTSERLTKIYLERLRRYDPQLRCVITLTEELALEQARRADAEIAAGKYRGPLHGIPWGAKDLLDTAGIATTYGAECFRNRVPAKNAAVVDRLNEAGAVLVAKLSMGALALNDIWFGGQTMNPWLLEEGSSGSSAGPGAAVGAGLVAFAMGSETEGSITSPSVRCGVTGLRPTFGRVPRTGAMTLCWSLDKLGPMARGVEDTLLVLDAIAGPDAGDLDSVPGNLDFDAAGAVQGLRIGYFTKWMHEPPATDVDRAALETARKLGMTPVEVSLPDWPYDDLNVILFAESAAAFEQITLNNKLDELRVQTPDAWPNTFRQSRFLSAVDFVQCDRFRRKVAAEMARVFSEVDVLMAPSLRDEMLTISNFTGHPSLTLRAGFVEVAEARSDWAPNPSMPLPRFNPPRRVPQGVTLLAPPFEEGRLAMAGMALEGALKVAAERPAGF